MWLLAQLVEPALQPGPVRLPGPAPLVQPRPQTQPPKIELSPELRESPLTDPEQLSEELERCRTNQPKHPKQSCSAVPHP